MENKKSENIQNIDNRNWKGVIGVILSCLFMHVSVIIFPLIGYYAYQNNNIIILTILGLMLAYQYSGHCHIQWWFIHLIGFNNQFQYFKNFTLKFEEKLPEKNSMIGSHPHGVIGYGIMLSAIQTKRYFTILASRVILSIPFNGLFLRWVGVESVNPQHLNKLMNNGRNIAIIPGGFEEATLTSTKSTSVYIKNRKGFIKYAIQHGYSVYPTYSFGENLVYDIVEPFLKFRLWLNKYKLPALIFYSKYGLLPYSERSIHTVVGKGLKFEKQKKPSKEYVNKCHQEYIDALVTLYNTHREEYGEKNDLQIY